MVHVTARSMESVHTVVQETSGETVVAWNDAVSCLMGSCSLMLETHPIGCRSWGFNCQLMEERVLEMLCCSQEL